MAFCLSRRGILVLAASLALGGAAPRAGVQRASEDPMLERITKEAERSELPEIIFQLTDAIGPRVVGSPATRAAERWIAQRLRAYGLRDVRIETNPPIDVGSGIRFDPPGWSWSRLTVQQLTPWQQTLIAVPVLYSPSTPGPVAGDVIVAPLPQPSESELTSFIERHRGKLQGRFLLLSDRESPIAVLETPASHRHTADDLKAMAAAAVSSAPRPAKPSPSTQPGPSSPSPSEVFDRYERLFEFLRVEGVLALIGPARRGSQGGTLFLRAPPAPPILAGSPPPMVDLAPEHFNRLLRLTTRKLPVRLEVNLEAARHGDKGTQNLLAEMPGTERSDEIVLVGAHLDSWHGGTGATDNAIGVATVLESVRILTMSRAPLRRTVRIAFWGGEELGLAGSRGYVERHLVGKNGQRTDAYTKLSGYLNLDYGSGRIRGIYLQGNDKLKPLFDEWLAGIGDGTLVATLRTTLGSDQATFERIGIPGLSFVQDPLNYEQRTHHTNMDEPDYIVLDDARASAIALASIIYRIANAETLLPRKEPQ